MELTMLNGATEESVREMMVARISVVTMEAEKRLDMGFIMQEE